MEPRLKDIPLAQLNPQELDRLREAEKSINKGHMPGENPGDVYLIAFSKKQ
ncbi:MAG: hypothetical protein AB1576_03655 [Bacillota bacterium]|jgi:hypothetical protein